MMAEHKTQAPGSMVGASHAGGGVGNPLHDPASGAPGQLAHDQYHNDLNNKYDVLKQTMPGVTITLKPIAAPMALGLAAMFSATWIFGTWYADWYGSDTSPLRLGAFVLLFGGIMQFMAGLACFPARDNLGSMWHTTWGAFFTAWGVYTILAAQGALPLRVSKYGGHDELAMWFVCMAGIDLVVLATTWTRDTILMITALFHFIGDVLFFGGFFGDLGSDNARRAIKAGGYFWMVSSLFALYRALGWLVNENFQHSWLPTFATAYERSQPRVRVPVGEPGIKKGQ